MRSRRYNSRISRFLHSLGESPLELLETLHYLVFGWVLLQTLIGFGGFVPYGEPLVGISLSLLVLAALHALVVAFRKERTGIDWEWLLPLPLLVYAWVHVRFLSPAPWAAALDLTVLVQAYILYLIIFDSIRGPRSGLWILTICQCVVILAVFAAFFQFYQFPGWMVTLDRERWPAFLEGAAGFLMDPRSLAPLILLILPASVFLVWLRRFPGPVRYWNGFLIFVLVIAYILSSHREGMAILLLLAIVLPFFLSKHWHVRRRLWLRGVLGGLCFGFLFWFSTDALRVRLLGYARGGSDPLEGASLAAAWERFRSSPLTGEGLGGFATQWETFRPAEVAGSVHYPFSLPLDLLSDMGLLGLLCVLLPLLWLLGRAFLIWRAVPFVTVTKDVASRMRRFPKNHPGRSHLERTQGRAPSSKIVLGSLLAGLVGFLAYLGWDYALRLPLHLFLFTSLLAAVAAYSRMTVRPRVGRLMGLTSGLLPLALAAWACAYGVPRFYAQHLVTTADERLNALLAEPDRIFLDSPILLPLIRDYTGAAELDPSHGGAWLGLGRAHLARLHADLWPADELAAEALPGLQRAVQVSPSLWMAHFELARCHALLQESGPVEAHLQAARELAPHRAEPLAFLAALRLLEDPRSEEGRAFLERSLALDPAYEPAFNTAQRLEMNNRPEGGRRASLLSEAVLAEQFGLAGYPRERIMGAGVMPPLKAGITPRLTL